LAPEEEAQAAVSVFLSSVPFQILKWTRQHGALMENRDAGQRHEGQNQIDWNAEHRGILRHHRNGA
jgi:hypothetical protein